MASDKESHLSLERRPCPVGWLTSNRHISALIGLRELILSLVIITKEDMMESVRQAGWILGQKGMMYSICE